MAEGEKIGGGYVEVTADLKNFDTAMAELPKKAAAKMDAAMRALQAKAAQTRLDLKLAYNAGDLEAQQKLQPLLENLKGKIRAVEAATIKQGQAARAEANAARAAAAEKIAAKAAEREAIQKTAQAERAAAAQAKMAAREQLLAQKATVATVAAGSGTSAGGMSGAMGLMMMSQLIDDMQYGFRAVVNQIPQLGMGLGAALGMGTEAATKLGGALGIAGVGVNLLINHWDELMDLMGTGRVLTEAEQMEKLAAATKLTADEQDRLNRFKREEATKQELKDKQSSAVEKTAAEVKSAIAEMGDETSTGRSKLVSGLVQARRAQGRGEKMTQEEERQLGIIERDFGGTKYGQQLEDKLRKKIQDRRDTADIDSAEKTVDTSTFDSEARKQLVNEIRKNPEAFPAGAAVNLGSIARPSTTVATAAQEEDPDIARTNAFNIEIARKAREDREQEDSRLASAMTGSVGKGLLEDAGISDETLESRIKKAMEDAGVGAEEIAAAVKGTAKKLREKMDAAVQERAVSRGINENVARDQLLKEANERDGKRAGNQPKAEVMSTESYLNKVLVAGLSKGEDTPKKQLTEAQTTNKKLDGVIKELARPKKGTYATAAPGRA